MQHGKKLENKAKILGKLPTNQTKLLNNHTKTMLHLINIEK
jgi:hypothetical protein